MIILNDGIEACEWLSLSHTVDKRHNMTTSDLQSSKHLYKANAIITAFFIEKLTEPQKGQMMSQGHRASKRHF